MKRLIFSLIYTLVTLAVFAANPLNVPDSLYQKGAYDQAVEEYTKIGAEQGVSAALLFNLGNAYYKLSKYGEAVHAYESALKLKPGNKQIKENLNFLRSKVADMNRADLKGKQLSVEPDTETFFETIHRWVAKDRASNSWSLLSLLSFILTLAGAAIYLFSRDVNIRKMGFFSMLGFLFFACSFMIFSIIAARYFTSHDEAVITAYSVELREDSNEDSKPTATPLHSGSKVLVLESKGDWSRVRYNSDFIGWMPTKDLKTI